MVGKRCQRGARGPGVGWTYGRLGVVLNGKAQGFGRYHSIKGSATSMRHQTPSEPGQIQPAATLASGSTSSNALSSDSETLDLVTRWGREDATTDPEQILAAERDIADFKQAMNEARVATGEPLLYP